MVIICDVDGVIADLHTTWLKRYNTRSGDHLTVSGITEWDLAKFVLPEWRSKIFDILREPDLYDFVHPINGSQQAIAYLQRKHRVVFTTSCVRGMADQKWEWLEAHGFLPRSYSHKNLVITADKSLIDGELIIDDSFEHCQAFPNYAYLFDQPWNRNEVFDGSWCQRVHGWMDIANIIEDKQ